jgi:hypothetical protein
VLRSWGAARDRHRQVYEHWFDGSRFAQIAEIKVVHSQITTPEALVERALTRSTSSPVVLGSRFEPSFSRPWPRSFPILPALNSSKPKQRFSRRPDGPADS